jgi:hypothetical protein
MWQLIRISNNQLILPRTTASNPSNFYRLDDLPFAQPDLDKITCLDAGSRKHCSEIISMTSQVSLSLRLDVWCCPNAPQKNEKSPGQSPAVQ